MVEYKVGLIEERYGLRLSPLWTTDLLMLLDKSCADVTGIFSGVIPEWMKGLQVSLEAIQAGGLTSPGLVRLRPNNLTRWTIVHELAHAWDFYTARRLSLGLKKFTRSRNAPLGLHLIFPKKKAFWYRVGSPPAPCGTDGNFNAMEDFAESVTAYVYPLEASRRATKRGMPYSDYDYKTFHETPRGVFIRSLVENNNQNALV
jgi:hypothetical protein